MNTFTKKIMKYANVDEAKAIEIQNFIDKYIYLDWSEAPRTEIKAAIEFAQEMM